MGSQGRNTQVNAQKYKHSWSFRKWLLREVVGHKVQRVFWDKIAKSPAYQEAGCYSVLTESNQGKN